MYVPIATDTAGGIASMVACLHSPLGQRLDGILTSFIVFTAVQAVAVVTHYLKWSQLAVRRSTKRTT